MKAHRRDIYLISISSQMVHFGRRATSIRGSLWHSVVLLLFVIILTCVSDYGLAAECPQLIADATITPTTSAPFVANGCTVAVNTNLVLSLSASSIILVGDSTEIIDATLSIEGPSPPVNGTSSSPPLHYDGTPPAIIRIEDSTFTDSLLVIRGVMPPHSQIVIRNCYMRIGAPTRSPIPAGGGVGFGLANSTALAVLLGPSLALSKGAVLTLDGVGMEYATEDDAVQPNVTVVGVMLQRLDVYEEAQLSILSTRLDLTTPIARDGYFVQCLPWAHSTGSLAGQPVIRFMRSAASAGNSSAVGGLLTVWESSIGVGYAAIGYAPRNVHFIDLGAAAMACGDVYGAGGGDGATAAHRHLVVRGCDVTSPYMGLSPTFLTFGPLSTFDGGSCRLEAASNWFFPTIDVGSPTRSGAFVLFIGAAIPHRVAVSITGNDFGPDAEAGSYAHRFIATALYPTGTFAIEGSLEVRDSTFTLQTNEATAPQILFNALHMGRAGTFILRGTMLLKHVAQIQPVMKVVGALEGWGRVAHCNTSLRDPNGVTTDLLGNAVLATASVAPTVRVQTFCPAVTTSASQAVTLTPTRSLAAAHTITITAPLTATRAGASTPTAAREFTPSVYWSQRTATPSLGPADDVPPTRTQTVAMPPREVTATVVIEEPPTTTTAVDVPSTTTTMAESTTPAPTTTASEPTTTTTTITTAAAPATVTASSAPTTTLATTATTTPSTAPTATPTANAETPEANTTTMVSDTATPATETTTAHAATTTADAPPTTAPTTAATATTLPLPAPSNSSAAPPPPPNASTSVPLPTTLAPVAASPLEGSRDAAGGIAGSIGIVTPGAGLLTVSLAIVRMSQCGRDAELEAARVSTPTTGGGDIYNNESSPSTTAVAEVTMVAVDVEIPFVCHPLQFGLGAGPMGYARGAVFSNLILIPLVFGIIVRFGIAPAIGRWFLPAGENPLLVLGWPSALVVPFTVLAEGTSYASILLLSTVAEGNDADATGANTVVGLIGVALCVLTVAYWCYVLYAVVPRHLLHIEQPRGGSARLVRGGGSPLSQQRGGRRISERAARARHVSRFQMAIRPFRDWVLREEDGDGANDDCDGEGEGEFGWQGQADEGESVAMGVLPDSALQPPTAVGFDGDAVPATVASQTPRASKHAMGGNGDEDFYGGSGASTDYRRYNGSGAQPHHQAEGGGGDLLPLPDSMKEEEEDADQPGSPVGHGAAKSIGGLIAPLATALLAPADVMAAATVVKAKGVLAYLGFRPKYVRVRIDYGEILRMNAHFVGEERWWLWADLAAAVCSLVVGLSEGLPDSLCKPRIIIALLATVAQFFVVVLSLVMAELATQGLLGAVNIVLVVIAVVRVFNDEDDGTADMLDAVSLFSNIIGIAAIIVSIGRSLVLVQSSLRRRRERSHQRASRVVLSGAAEGGESGAWIELPQLPTPADDNSDVVDAEDDGTNPDGTRYGHIDYNCPEMQRQHADNPLAWAMAKAEGAAHKAKAAALKGSHAIASNIQDGLGVGTARRRMTNHYALDGRGLTEEEQLAIAGRRAATDIDDLDL